jgi:uncharacterized membrane protein
MTENDPKDAAETHGDPTHRGEIETVPPAIDAALRSAGVDPQDPNITKTVGISLNMMTARGHLPLPPPQLLNEYDQVYPGLTAKIVAWTDEQRHHRMELERLVTTGSESRMNRGQVIAGAVALCGLCLAALVGTYGNPWVAGVIAVVSVGGPTAAVYLARGEMAPKMAGRDTPKNLKESKV